MNLIYKPILVYIFLFYFFGFLDFLFYFILFYFPNSNRGPTIIKLYIYIFTFYHYTNIPTNYIMKIAYLILYLILIFKDKIFKFFIFKNI